MIINRSQNYNICLFPIQNMLLIRRAKILSILTVSSISISKELSFWCISETPQSNQTEELFDFSLNCFPHLPLLSCAKWMQSCKMATLSPRAQTMHIYNPGNVDKRTNTYIYCKDGNRTTLKVVISLKSTWMRAWPSFSVEATVGLGDWLSVRDEWGSAGALLPTHRHVR